MLGWSVVRNGREHNWRGAKMRIKGIRQTNKTESKEGKEGTWQLSTLLIIIYKNPSYNTKHHDSIQGDLKLLKRYRFEIVQPDRP